MTESRILITYDSARPPNVLETYLQASQSEVKVVPLRSTTLHDIELFQPQLVVVDCDDDLTDALNMCGELCTNPRTAAIPIVMLAASHDEVDEIVAFKVGVSDYIAKPFRMKPVVQRLKSLLRRVGRPAASRDIVDVAGLKLHRLRKVVEIEGRTLKLTSTECDILELLASRPGYPFHRRAILNYCRGLKHNGSEKSIDVHIHNLRRKLPDIDLIQTQRGFGYYLNAGATDK